MDTASLLTTVLLLLISVIGFFLKSLYSEIMDMKKGRIQRGLEMERMKSDVKQLTEEMSAVKEKQAKHDERTELFYREFGDMVTKAVTPLFDAIRLELGHIQKDIESLK